ncbi:MAG: late competence development ComFB family protein [Candidatus Omnitrophica bacterium]|nr:late competence development ComFB family protein [Candidatus Omnitrophota bacterium]
MTQSKLRNITAEIVRERLTRALSIRYDICSCITCEDDMLAYILSRLPVQYSTTEKGAIHTLAEKNSPEEESKINHLILIAIDIVSKNPKHKLKEDRQELFKLMLKKIFEERGIDFRNYHQEILKRRLATRVRANGLKSYSEYMNFLFSNPEEYDKLFETLCINVSEFFRDGDIWITVKYLLENLIRLKNNNNDKSIKIWSAGCASGEEPYTVAIILKELLKNDLDKFSLEIYGTDIDKKCLRDAEEALYPKESVKNLDPKIAEKYFQLSGGNYKLKSEIKNMVKFLYQDLTTPDLIENTDVLFCRNVFIYFNRYLQKELVAKFHRSLKSKGYIVMGKVETILRDFNELFEEADAGANIFRNK